MGDFWSQIAESVRSEITMQPDAAAFTIARDGSFVATRERDGTVRLWRTPHRV